MKAIDLNYENYKTVQNCIVKDENGSEVFVGNQTEVLILTADDKQDSQTFVGFDNDTCITFDRKGCFYTSKLSLEINIDYFLNDIGSNYFVWGEQIKDQLLEKYPEKKERINEVDKKRN